jgi:hypothetical protein
MDRDWPAVASSSLAPNTKKGERFAPTLERHQTRLGRTSCSKLALLARHFARRADGADAG